MLILGTWFSLLLYSVSWVSGLTLDSSSRYAWLDLQVLRLAWLLHTLVLLITLYTVSQWPATFVGDFLNGVAWVCLVVSQAFPGRWKTMNHSSMLRVFSILLLGLSTSISQVHFPGLAVIHEQNWLHQTLLASHVISFICRLRTVRSCLRSSNPFPLSGASNQSQTRGHRKKYVSPRWLL